MAAIFRKTIIFSLFCHLSVFSIFSFSFGTRTNADYRGAYFWGPLPATSNQTVLFDSGNNLIQRILISRPETIIEKNRESLSLPQGYLKPKFYLVLSPGKKTFLPKTDSAYSWPQRKEAVLMFYPELPYQFNLYFQDRQMAHIELIFLINGQGDGMGEVTVKRKISSGNLEADLLSMRYISHYLFIQRSRFITGTWQSVKIDLAAKNDYY